MTWITHNVKTFTEVDEFRIEALKKGFSCLFSKNDRDDYTLYFNNSNEECIINFVKDFKEIEIDKDYCENRTLDLNALLNQMKLSTSDEELKYSIGFLYKEIKRLIDRNNIIIFSNVNGERRHARKISDLHFKDNDIRKPHFSITGLRTGMAYWVDLSLFDVNFIKV